MMSGKRKTNLTTSQLLIWLGHQQHPDTPIYNMSAAFRIGKKLDEEAFARALQKTIDESDSLKSTFVEKKGVPHHRMLAGMPFDLDRVDFRSPGADDTKLDDFMQARLVQPFNLGERCFDSVLIRTGDDQYVWFLVIHHLICDAWAMKLIFERVEQNYRQETLGQAAPPAGPDFKTFCAFEQSEAKTDEGRQAQRCWRALGEDWKATPPMSIFGREASPDKAATKSTRITIELGEERTAALSRLASEPPYRGLNKDLTQFQIFSTVLFALLYHAAGRETLYTGAASANRASADHRSVIGLLMEIYALRVEASADDMLTDLFDKVRIESLNFLRHALPGASNSEIVQASEVLLNFLTLSFPRFDGAQVSTRLLHSGASEPHHLLRIQIRDFDSAGNFHVDFDFNDAAFDERLSRGFANGYLHVLDAVLEGREQNLKDLDLLDEHTRAFLLTELNNTKADYPSEKPLHALFEAQAHISPDRPAVVDEGGVLTYRALNIRADKLAHVLKERGVRQGDIVAVIAPPGAGFVITMLGILKSGGAYAPVDPNWPAQRQALILKRLSPKVIIAETDVALKADFPVNAIISLQDVERDNVLFTDSIDVSDLAIDNIAYVLFTSGSTGEPKGVRCRHRGVINLLLDFEQRAPVASGAHVSWWTNTCFDVSVYEIFSALVFGRTLHVPPAHIRSDAKLFYDWLGQCDIRSAYVPPFMLDIFAALSAGDKGRLSLQRMLVGVEPIAEATLRALQASVDGLQIVNGYGPTEATICATLYNVPAAGSVSRRSPIGKPVRNTRVYVLNEHGKPVPFGAPGELYIAGDGLASGYLKDAALTDEKFVYEPYSDASDARMYRTGDRVRYLEDGNLEFLGRIDQQLKIRGHRIEPAEIEMALCAQPGVREALVTVDDESGEKRLIAYVVSYDATETTTSEWFERLHSVLPRHMIPAVYITLNSFPLTPSGKIDRNALPKPKKKEEPQKPAWSPGDDLAKVILDVWREALGVEAIGGDDHFIDLGGDSMKAMQICARLHEKGVKVSPRQLFDAPTISALSDRLQGR
ncbi:MAG: amino acid adenylation domain-containing protein [Pseudomonadota bacterium]